MSRRSRGRWGGSKGGGEGQRTVGRVIGRWRWGGPKGGREGQSAVERDIRRWEGTEGSLGSMGGV